MHDVRLPDDDYSGIAPGMNLARLRELRGLSQGDLADMIGVSQATISRAESGHPSAKLETYTKCAEVLGTTLAEIFADDRSVVEAQLVRRFRALPPEIVAAWVAALPQEEVPPDAKK